MTGLVGAGSAQAEPTTYDPFAVAQGFTILAQGDAALDNGELEGSIAAFGTLATDVENYPVLHRVDGLADYGVPIVDGEPVRLLADELTGDGGFDVTNADNSGTVDPSSPEANATARFADVSALDLVSRSGGEGDNTTGQFVRAANTEGGRADLKAMPFDGAEVTDLQTERSAVQDYFPDVDGQIAQVDACLAGMYGDSGLVNEVTVETDNNLVYLSGFLDDRPNVIDYDDVAGAVIKMDHADGYVPTAQAPLVVRVAAGTTEIGPINFEGWSSGSAAQQSYARYLMLDMSRVTGDVVIDGLEMGALWAPQANIEFNSGISTNGQWVTQDLTTTGGGEIHHQEFAGQLPCEQAAPTMDSYASVVIDGATAADDKLLPVDGGTVVDTIDYTGLEVDREYTLSGEIMTADGTSTDVEGAATFTAEAADGSVDVVFEVDADTAQDYVAQDLVVFEALALDGESVLNHRDLADADQTVTVAEAPGPSPTPTPTPSPSPSPSVSPSPSPSGSPTPSSSPVPSSPTPDVSPSAATGPDDLPVTGPGALVATLTGAAVLLLAGGALLVIRRRFSTTD